MNRWLIVLASYVAVSMLLFVVCYNYVLSIPAVQLVLKLGGVDLA